MNTLTISKFYLKIFTKSYKKVKRYERSLMASKIKTVILVFLKRCIKRKLEYDCPLVHG